jgi:hypothetical protein
MAIAQRAGCGHQPYIGQCVALRDTVDVPEVAADDPGG